MPEKLSIEGEQFSLLGIQRSGGAVYRGTSTYLRLGEASLIAYDRARHREMEEKGYPVARIKLEGEYQGFAYFIERSLGERSFRAQFEEEYNARGAVSQSTFASYTAVIKKLYGAQLKSVRDTWDLGEFAAGIRVTHFARELPTYTREIETAFVAAGQRLKKLPGVLLHGDCNASNVYEGGIIDLEDSFYGPLGYDQVSALMSIEWSPQTRDHEFYAQYQFNEEQKSSYYKSLNVLGAKHGVPNLANYARDLAFCRAIWLSSGMHAWPRTQQWRYQKFVNSYLHD